MIDVNWLSEVDWNYWEGSSKSLQDDHSTIARKAPAETTIERLAEQKNSGFSETRQLYIDLLKKLIVEIRSRGYSIRTEQAYEPWGCRFIFFCDNRDPFLA
jgi:hypothetical protein